MPGVMLRRRIATLGQQPVGSRSFNGTTDRIDFASIATLTSSPITISAWIKPAVVDATRYILCIHNSGDTQYGIVFDILETGLASMIRHAVTDLLQNGTNAHAAGSWYHFLMTHTGAMTDVSTVKFRVNGVEQTNDTGEAGSNDEYAQTGSWSIGGRIYSDTRNFSGSICQVATWKRVLSAGEITSLAAGYAASRYPTDLSFYWKGNTPDLRDSVTKTVGVLDGTTFVAGDGPRIIYS